MKFLREELKQLVASRLAVIGSCLVVPEWLFECFSASLVDVGQVKDWGLQPLHEAELGLPSNLLESR